MWRAEHARRRTFAPRARVAAALISTLGGAGIGLLLLFTGVFAGLEQQSLAARFALRGAQHRHGVVVVGIDDRSFSALRQRWPFPRSWHGALLRRLHSAGARAVFYDVQFSEPTTQAQDLALFNSLGATGGAILATTAASHGHSDVLGGDANLRQVHSRAAGAVLPVNQGGVVTRVPAEESGLPTAAVAVTQRLGLRTPASSLFAHGGGLIDYAGPPGTLPTISFADVLEGHFTPSSVRGAVVVVGATASSLQDMHPTPASDTALMSGPEMQANAVWTLLHGLPLRPLSGALSAALVVLLGGLASLARLRRSAPVAVLLACGCAGLYALAAQILFDRGTVLPVLAPLGSLTTGTLLMLVTSHLLTSLELRATQLEIVQRLGRAAEARDGESARHLERIGILAERLASAAGWSRREARLLRQASALHDVGKIAVPDVVLLKPGRFDSAERATMQTHASRGADLLAGSTTSLIQMAETIARSHHERWDGSGYPEGLRGEQIPVAARICAICDVFDALISRRRYKAGWTLDAAVQALAEGAGTHFDPELTAIFVRIAPSVYQELMTREDADLAAPGPAVTDSAVAGTAPSLGQRDGDRLPGLA